MVAIPLTVITCILWAPANYATSPQYTESLKRIFGIPDNDTAPEREKETTPALRTRLKRLVSRKGPADGSKIV